MTRNPKILVHIISSLQRGGAETMLVNLIKHLPDFKHHVFYVHDGPLRVELTNLSIPTYHVKGIVYGNLYALYLLIQQIQQMQPYCIHTSLWGANIIGYCIRFFTGIPVVSAVHALCEHEGKLRTWIERCIPLQPSCYIAVSSTVALSLKQRKKIQPSTITIIHNGIDTYELSCFRGQSKASYPIPFVIGSVGRFVAVKNYLGLLESFALIHRRFDIRLMLIGHGPQENLLRSAARDLAISNNVIFISGQNARVYYQQFDCFVQPSYYEGLSLALLEALYFELPVIVGSRNNHHEIITHRHNGLLVDPYNTQQLAATLETIITDSSLRHYLKEKGYATVLNNFTIEKTANKYRTVMSYATYMSSTGAKKQ